MGQPLQFLPALLDGLVYTLLVLVVFYWWTILIVIIASFVAQGNYHPALAILSQLVEPLLAPVRKVIPSLGPLDLSPIVVLLGLRLVQVALESV